MTRYTPYSQSQQNIEIIPNRVYFSILKSPHKSQINDPKHAHKESIIVCVDTKQEFQYLPFYYDFGPPSLLQIHKFYYLILSKMQTHPNAIIYYCTSTQPNHIANGVLFITSFRMIHLKMNPDEAYTPCASLNLKPFRDASTMPCLYDLTVISCLKGLYHAMQLGWYDPSNFNAEKWDAIEQVQNGDMNWIIPHKILAFATPYNTNFLPGGWRVATPNDIVPTFKELGITHIIRLCQKFYNESIFIKAGFNHTELYFLDGSNPPLAIREKFLQIAEGDDVIALHCKAGLGRTGTLIGCYLIKNHQFTAHEAIGWIRICRPGSIIGPQQKYLVSYAERGIRPPISRPPNPVPAHTTINNSTSTSSVTGNLTDKVLEQDKSKSLLDQNLKDLSTKQKVITNPNSPSHKKNNTGYTGTKLSSASSNPSATTSTSSTGTNSTSYLSSSQYRVGSISNRTSARGGQKVTPSAQITTTKKIVHPGKSSATSQRSTGSSKRTNEMLSVKSIGVTPYYPQPRKEKRAAKTAGTNVRPNITKQ